MNNEMEQKDTYKLIYPLQPARGEMKISDPKEYLILRFKHAENMVLVDTVRSMKESSEVTKAVESYSLMEHFARLLRKTLDVNVKDETNSLNPKYQAVKTLFQSMLDGYTGKPKIATTYTELQVRGNFSRAINDFRTALEQFKNGTIEKGTSLLIAINYFSNMEYLANIFSSYATEDLETTGCDILAEYHQLKNDFTSYLKNYAEHLVKKKMKADAADKDGDLPTDTTEKSKDKAKDDENGVVERLLNCVEKAENSLIQYSYKGMEHPKHVIDAVYRFSSLKYDTTTLKKMTNLNVEDYHNPHNAKFRTAVSIFFSMLSKYTEGVPRSKELYTEDHILDEFRSAITTCDINFQALIDNKNRGFIYGTPMFCMMRSYDYMVYWANVVTRYYGKEFWEKCEDLYTKYNEITNKFMILLDGMYDGCIKRLERLEEKESEAEQLAKDIFGKVNEILQKPDPEQPDPDTEVLDPIPSMEPIPPTDIVIHFKNSMVDLEASLNRGETNPNAMRDIITDYKDFVYWKTLMDKAKNPLVEFIPQMTKLDRQYASFLHKNTELYKKITGIEVTPADTKESSKSE